MLTKYRVEPKSKWRCPWVEGYASANRVKPGQSINFHISTNPASNVSIDIYRMGYYQGNGGRPMTKLGPFACKPQSDPRSVRASARVSMGCHHLVHRPK